MLGIWLAVTASAVTPPDTGDTGEPVGPGFDLDGDSDGWTPRDGDCDDDDPEVNPGVVEVCFDEIDNDCNALSDEECDATARLASLRGGGGCTGGAGVGGTTAALFLLPLVLAPFVRRSA